MSGFLGMDPAGVRAHAQRMRAAARRVESLRLRIEATVAAVPWSGPDADAFRGRWHGTGGDRLLLVTTDLVSLGAGAERHADAQDAASEGGAGGTGPELPSSIPPAPPGVLRPGYLRDDSPLLANWFEDPLEHAVSGTVHATSDVIGRGWDLGLDSLGEGLEDRGRRSAAIGRLRSDGDHFGGILEEWAGGERVPAGAELFASGLVALGSGGAVAYEARTGTATPLMDDRPGGIVTAVHVDERPRAAPRDLGDLIIDNDALRMPRTSGSGALGTGRIGVQEVQGARGGDPAFVVQVPPTEGAGLQEFPGAYGAQGNSRDWGSNLRLVAGQDPAAMDDVRAALTAAEVPAGSDVLLVGHSQGGIIAAHLAADPGFNSASGAAGTFNVTHSFSMGSPVQTVLPAQASTEVVNVAHGPVGLAPRVVPGPDLQYTGDPVAQLDLQGAQVGGGALSAPNVHEVMLPGTTQQVGDGLAGVANNHESVAAGSPDYHGSVQRCASTDPVLSALRNDLEGRYLGPGAYVARSTVVEVGRGEP